MSNNTDTREYVRANHSSQAQYRLVPTDKFAQIWQRLPVLICTDQSHYCRWAATSASSCQLPSSGHELVSAGIKLRAIASTDQPCANLLIVTIKRYQLQTWCPTHESQPQPLNIMVFCPLPQICLFRNEKFKPVEVINTDNSSRSRSPNGPSVLGTMQTSQYKGSRGHRGGTVFLSVYSTS
jgi:hypothetical protein